MGSSLFRSTDIDAPQLTTDTYPNNTLILLLKAVLVDGYGETPSLGWSLEFEDVDNAVAVFRMPEGSRTYIRIDESGLGDDAKVRCYETMSSVNEGIAPCPPLVETTNNYICKRDGVLAINVAWSIIGDSKGFYFITDATGLGTEPTNIAYNSHQIHYLGDYIPFSEEDKDIFCCVLCNGSSKGLFAPSSTTTAGFYVMRYRDRRRGSRLVGTITGSTAQVQFGNQSHYRPPGNALAFTTPMITENFIAAKGDVGPYNPTIVGNYPMAFLPGFLNIFGNIWGYTIEELLQKTKPYYVTENGENRYYIFCIKFGTGYSEQSYQRICIRLGEDFRNV